MDITNIAIAMISLFTAVITCFAIPLLRKKTSTETYAQIKFWTKIAVEAAEQLFDQPGMGKEKREYVIEFLNKRGYCVDVEAIDNMIEACVHELKESLIN